VVLTIELMDLVFSIDNVIAAVSLSDELWVVMLGVGIGILAMRFAAGLFSYAVERWPILKPAAYVLILNIGAQLILEQLWHVEISEGTRFFISAGIIVGSLLYARLAFLQTLKPVLMGLSFLMGVTNKAIDLAILPLRMLFQWVFNGFRVSRAEGA
jgi:tellurite resistance protein TerC